MNRHYKTDLLTDEAMASFTTKVGDILTLEVPNAEGGFTRGEHTVTEVEIRDGGEHPESKVHLTRVTLTLEG